MLMFETLPYPETGDNAFQIANSFSRILETEFTLPDGTQRSLYYTALATYMEGDESRIENLNPNLSEHIYTQPVLWSPDTNAKITTTPSQKLSEVRLDNPALGYLKIDYEIRPVSLTESRPVTLYKNRTTTFTANKAFIKLTYGKDRIKLFSEEIRYPTADSFSNEGDLSIGETRAIYQFYVENYFANRSQLRKTKEEELLAS